jgi:hypothetical protein
MPPVIENSIRPELREPAMPKALAIRAASRSKSLPTTAAVPNTPTTPGE